MNITRLSLSSFRLHYSFLNISTRSYHKSFFPLNSSKPFNPHKVLGVLDTATDDEIRKEYRKLAKKYHPDISKEPNAEQKFVEIQKAYNMIKNEEVRKETKLNESFGDIFEGIDLNSIDEKEKEVIVMILDNIRHKKSIIGGFLSSNIAYEVSKLRNKESKYRYTVNSVKDIFPHYVALIAEDHWSTNTNKLELNIFSRTEDQHAIGKIFYDIKDRKMEWVSTDDKLIASAIYSIPSQSKQKTFSKTEKFIVKSNSSILGAINIKGWNWFPFIKLISIHLPDTSLKSIDGTKFCMFGTRMIWTDMKRNKTLATVSRELFAPFGRIYDLDISSNHFDIHPALYLFTIAQAHQHERHFSIAYPLGKILLKYLNTPNQTDFSDKQKQKKEK